MLYVKEVNRLKNQRFFNREFVLTFATSDTNIAGYWQYGGLG